MNTDHPAAPAPDDAALPAFASGRIDRKVIDSVEVRLEAFLGAARMTVAELFELKADSVVPLDAPLNQAVELRLNGVAIGRGELVAVGENFGVRLTEISR